MLFLANILYQVLKNNQWFDYKVILILILFLGGTFPPPPSACQLMQVLPPPGCFHGPFVSVDMLMDIFLRLILPDKGKLTIMYIILITIIEI